MGIDTARYHGWRGELRSPWLACLALVRVCLLQIFRRKVYWFVLALGLLHFLVRWVAIYIAALFPQAKAGILQLFEINPYYTPEQESGYIGFMFWQSLIVTILLAFAGSTLVGDDFRFRSLPFFLSRRIDRRHYIIGKLMAIATLTALLTIVPSLLLFLEFGMLTTDFEYWFENWRIPVSVVGYGAIICLFLSIGIVSLSAHLQKTAPIAITWASVFLLLASMADLLNDSTVYWNLIDPWRDMRYVGRLCFGTFNKDTDRELAWYSVYILSAVCAVALAALVHRVRAVDIVE